jgi:O-acetyl-ADP-ribose deacetylase (regulator of RNase III)
MRLVVCEGDITQQDSDAIVNAANTALRPGGGVDGAITRAAGPQALAERERLIAERGRPPLPTGQAVATGGGDLRARWIIHTAGPVYSGRGIDQVLLARCHESCLRIADELRARSVAFPAISTGVYGYPPDAAAHIAASAVMEVATDVEEVRFVLFGQAMLEIFLEATGEEAALRRWNADAEGRWNPPEG